MRKFVGYTLLAMNERFSRSINLKSAFQTLFVLGTLVCLTHACSQSVAAKPADPVAEVTLLAGISKESLAAVNASVSQTETELAAIHARLKTQIEGLALTAAKATELLNLLKEFQKEQRADRLAERLSKERALIESEAKLQADNQAIAAQMKEAKEKAELAMQAAQTGLVIGIVQGLIQTGAAASAFGQGDTSAFTTLLQQQLLNVNFQVLEIRKDVGLTLRIRVGQITSCLSTKQQCNGLSFTNTK